MESSFQVYLWRVGLSLPLILAAIAGIAWAVVNWKKASTAALAATIACAALLLFSCIGPAGHIWLPRLFTGQGQDAFRRLVWVHRGLDMCSSGVLALCVGGLIFATFAGRAEGKTSREEKRKRRKDEDEEE